MKKLFIFDLDGTLLDTVHDLGKSGNHVLSIAGYPTHPIDAYYNFVGNGIAKLLERALPADVATEQEAARLLPLFRTYYNEHKADDTIPYEGIPRLLATLQERGASIAVASNKYQQATEELIRHYFPEIEFIAIFGQRDGVPIKPHPAIVYDIMQASDIFDKQDIMYIGDSIVDMNTARNAGVEAVGVSWGFSRCDKLVACAPDHIVDTVAELSAILL